LLFILPKSVLKLKLDPALLALAYAVSIDEERHPAANDFEENDHFRVVKLKNAKMRKRENVKTRKFRVPGRFHEVHNAKAFSAISHFRVFEA
jgi:hypothetical protein